MPSKYDNHGQPMAGTVWTPPITERCTFAEDHYPRLAAMFKEWLDDEPNSSRSALFGRSQTADDIVWTAADHRRINAELDKIGARQ